MGKEDPVVTEQGAVQIPLKWGSGEHLDTVYVNHMFITGAGAEVYLVFGELVMPFSLGPDDVPKELEIVPKVRLAVTPDVMRNMARAVQQVVERLSKKGAT